MAKTQDIVDRDAALKRLGFDTVRAYAADRIAKGVTIQAAMAESGFSRIQLLTADVHSGQRWIDVVEVAPSQHSAAQMDALRDQTQEIRARRDMDKLETLRRLNGTYGGVRAADEIGLGRGATFRQPRGLL